MGIEFSEEAVELLQRSLELSTVDRSTGGIRLRGARGLGGGFDIQVELAEGPLENESVMEAGGIRVFVDPEVTTVFPSAIVTVEPQHDTIVVRPRPQDPSGDGPPEAPDYL